MPRSFDQSDYELWAENGMLNTLRDFDTEALRMAGDGLRKLLTRANSVTGLKSNYVPTTSERVQSSYNPGAADFRQLTASECIKAYDRCLQTLSDDDRELVVRMVIGGAAALEVAKERLRVAMNDRTAKEIIKHDLCRALKTLAPAIRQENRRARMSDVANKSQS
jgi:hypothetical protein